MYGIQVEAAEYHAHVEADWYMLTVTTDLLAFIYVALFYQVLLLCLQPTCFRGEFSACSLLGCS